MKKPIAIVLAGSGENRTAEPFYKIPQEVYTADILSNMGLETYITRKPSTDTNSDYGILNIIYPDQGAIHAIISLLTDKNSETALLVPCDMPLLDADILQQLVDTYEKEDTIVCFRQHGTPYIEPFPAIFEKAVLELLVTDVASGKITLQELLKHAGSHLVDVPSDNRFLNVADEGATEIIKQKLSAK